jgi:hypothetical protein
MTFALAQSAEGTSAVASVTGLAFSVAPTSGNLIVLTFAAGAYVHTPSSDWSQSIKTQHNFAQYVWWKISDGTNSFAYTLSATAPSSWILAEFSGGPDQIDVTGAQLVASSGTGYTTPTITPGTGERLLLATLAGDMTGNASGDQTTWLNSFTHVRTSGPASGTGVLNMGLGYRVVTGDDSTTYSSGSTFPTTLTTRHGTISSFKGVGNLTATTAPAFRSVSSISYASRTNATVSAPSGLANDDIMLAVVVTATSGTGLGTAVAVTPPAGWKAFTTPQETDDGSFTAKVWMFWKRAASESGSYTFTHATSNSQAIIAAFSGCVTTGPPFDGWSMNFGRATVGAAPSILPNSTNDLLIYADHGWTGSATTPPTGFTEQFDTTLLTLATKVLTARGNTGTVSHTTSAPWGTYLVALRAAAVTVGKPVKVWSGSAWVTKVLKVWSGSAWVVKPAKVWNGSAWV